MTKDEAMKLALEALRQIDEAMPFPVAKLAQAALREALAEQPAQQEHDDLTIAYIAGLSRGKDLALQRTWVGLTDEEVKDIVWNLPYEPSQEHIRAIEAKLKEKNT